MSARESRDKKEMERFAPVQKAEKAKNVIHEGSGTKLADIPIVPVNLNKIDADHDLLKALHSFLYGVAGKKTVRKKNIRSFSGFPEGDNGVREAKIKKMTDSKKWTVAALKDLCTLLGVDKKGDKAEVVDRIVTFLCSPDPSASKGPVAKKPKPVKKKSVGKGKKAKKVKRVMKPRAKSGYAVFSVEARAKIMKNGESMTPQEVMAKLGEKWSECSDAQKEKYKQKGIKEFEKSQKAAAEAGAQEEEEDEVEDDAEEEEDMDEDGEDDEE